MVSVMSTSSIMTRNPIDTRTTSSSGGDPVGSGADNDDMIDVDETVPESTVDPGVIRGIFCHTTLTTYHYTPHTTTITTPYHRNPIVLWDAPYPQHCLIHL